MVAMQTFTHLPTEITAFIWNGEEVDDPALSVVYVNDPAWIGGTGKRKMLRIRGRGTYSFAQLGDRVAHYPSGEWQALPPSAFDELYLLTTRP